MAGLSYKSKPERPTLKPVSRPSRSCWTRASRSFTTTSKASNKPDNEDTSGCSELSNEAVTPLVLSLDNVHRPKKKKNLLNPRVETMLFKAPLISSKRSSTREARAVLVSRRTSFETGRAATLACAALTADVMLSTLVRKVAAAVSLSAAEELALKPAAVESTHG